MHTLVMSRRSSPKAAFATLVFVALLGSPTEMLSTSPAGDEGWEAVTHLDHSASFTFVDRNHTCTGGKIKAADNLKVTISRQDGPEIDIARKSATNHIRSIGSGSRL